MGDRVELFFTAEPIADAVWNRVKLSEPIIKILPSRTCKTARNVLFVKLTENRKETQQWN